MAKIAQCGYGSQGQGVGKTGNGYTYVVSDNVRTGDQIQVIATSTRYDKEQQRRVSTGRKFATTAVPKHIFKENTAKGQSAIQKAQQAGKEVTQSYTGAEVGAGGSRRKPSEDEQSQYTKETRAGNVAEYLKTHPNTELTKNTQETFESYSRKFMKKEQE